MVFHLDDMRYAQGRALVQGLLVYMFHCLTSSYRALLLLDSRKHISCNIGGNILAVLLLKSTL